MPLCAAKLEVYMSEALLQVENIEVYYGLIKALKGISFTVNRGEVVSLIGANGAGKTTTLHTITGLLRPKVGKITYNGQDITKVPAHKIVTMGVVHVPEGRRVFKDLSVYDNLCLGAYTVQNKENIADNLAMVYDLFPRLEERKNQMSGTLSGGEQQMLAMGRALMSNPEMIVMDEPSMGLSPLLVNEVFKIIETVHSRNITVLLVEQNSKKALAVSDRAYVLETGNIIMEGKASDLANDERVKKAYLGA
ncbi:MAG: ABC transporter ATP-binding protein [Clostridia bacterium]|nr:ABC transporter ATP-binding protein [Clostridia bacterium]